MADVLIAGGGVVGLAIARELALSGLKVTLLDRQNFGREASWAGAGILPPTVPTPPDDLLNRLTTATHALWPRLAADLLETTGIDNGFRTCGGITLPGDAVDVAELTFREPERRLPDDEINAWRRSGALVEPLDAGAIEHLEPALAPQPRGGFRLPELCQVRNPRHLRALLADVQRLGVDLQPDCEVLELCREGERVLGVTTTTGRIAAGAVVIAAGAWSRTLLPPESVAFPQIEPVRGQIVLYRLERPPVRHVIECGHRYIVPRDDGRVLVGSTEERAGFDHRTTPEGIAGPEAFAMTLLPSLRDAVKEREWAGLRPYSSSPLPSIGPVPGFSRLYVATGHFRSGLHLSPITARLMRQMITGQTPDYPVRV